eukprot:TRINITY_DN5418_c0_g1_i3.p1 TRINITY_DN5418_c0_g1~~TRINITY_DN5418_c0_g1_i3.p1  ORF type:complete len:327 (+),score=92.47 TRINITY_DN5418_c0_g1_i3:938-1918(+)
MEFEKTATGNLTLDEFEILDLEEEADPPAFTAARKKDLREERKRKHEQLGYKSEEFCAHTSCENSECPNTPTSTFNPNLPAASTEQQLNDEFDRAAEEINQMSGLNALASQAPPPSSQIPDSQPLEMPASSPSATQTKLALTVTSQLQKLREKERVVQELNSLPQKEYEKEFDQEEEDTLSDIEESEIDMYINSEQEQLFKTEMWMSLNGDFMKKLEQREKELAENPHSAKKKTVRKKPSGTPRKTATTKTAESPAEAVAEALKTKKMSGRINYSAMEDLFDDAVFDTDRSTKSSEKGGRSAYSKGYSDDEDFALRGSRLNTQAIY